MDSLPRDVLRQHILLLLPFDPDLRSARRVCRDWAREMDDAFFRSVAVRDWGSAFWAEAELRPLSMRRPLASWLRELLRIDRFQRTLVDLGMPPFRTRDFLDLWRSQARAAAAAR